MTRDPDYDIQMSRAMKEKIRRQNRSEEIKARDRERNRLLTQQRRKNESEEEKQTRREKQRVMQRIARMNESEEARALRLENGRIRAKFRRLNESYEQRQMRLEKERVNARLKRMMETTEQKETRRRRDTLRQKEKRQKKKLIDLFSKNTQNPDDLLTSCNNSAESIIIQPEIIQEVLFGKNLYKTLRGESNQKNDERICMKKEETGGSRTTNNNVDPHAMQQQTNLLISTLKSNNIGFNIKSSETLVYENLQPMKPTYHYNPYLLLETDATSINKEQMYSSGEEAEDTQSEYIGQPRAVPLPSGYQRYSNAQRNCVTMNLNLETLKERISKNHTSQNEFECANRTAFFQKLESHHSLEQYTKDMFEKMQIIGQVEQDIFLAKLFKDLYIIDRNRLNEQFLTENHHYQQQKSLKEEEKRNRFLKGISWKGWQIWINHGSALMAGQL